MMMLTQCLGKIIGLLMVSLLISCQQKSPNSSLSNISLTMPSTSVILGEVSDDPTEVFESFQPLADYLTYQLNGDEKKIGKVEVAPDMKTMAKWLKSGKVELYFDSPYPAFLVSEASGSQVILSRWKGGVSSYESVLISLRDQGVKQIHELQGKTIAFEEKFSTSGYMLPYNYLKAQGLILKEKTSESQSFSKNETAYIFSGSDKNSLQWLVSGRVDAMAMGSVDFQQLPQATRQQFIIMGKTKSVPRHMVVISPTLSQNKVTRLKNILLQMNKTDSGKTILEQFEKTTKFAEFPDNKTDIFHEIRPLINSNLK
ncbi:phosphate/phosphite/phosphonate ABC transporter substrate-binding protein [Cyanothece sp. BG0011]|uniref:phosphate/phosphite/phosphonate ABC transporter substrate-binding protein n=1 Tax=Cyanothece sp. BG0011 TaxID=2082950 RepID=UPI0018E4E955|nr:phosphate/phosphite/phosphonate ABC transporter substrate-binding protein [Cyanothece sp. BG0011]